MIQKSKEDVTGISQSIQLFIKISLLKIIVFLLKINKMKQSRSPQFFVLLFDIAIYLSTFAPWKGL